MHLFPKDGQANGPVLIFPAGMPRSLEYLRRRQDEGLPVVGASSIPADPARARYPAWTYLPFVTDPAFPDALRNAIHGLDISGVFSPNPVVWNYLRDLLPRLAPNVGLVNAWPVDTELTGYRAAQRQADEWLREPLPLVAEGAPAMSRIELAALFRHVEQIPGMCDHEKLTALIEIFRRTVPGDVVEIGSWWGKSAFVLNRLAQHHRIGSVLCIDPWSDEHLVQKDSSGMVDSGSAMASAEEARIVFEMNLLPYAQGRLNYLRMPSIEGAAHYRRTRSIDSAVFGRTDYTGQISVLHIDGNHAYEAARGDIDAWADMVANGGWIIVDDYVWPYGDGPRRAADEFLSARWRSLSGAFVMGSALFVQMKKPVTNG